MSDSESQSQKVGCIERFPDIQNSIVSSMSASEFESTISRLKVKFVMNNQNLLRVNLEIGHTGRNRSTAVIHESGRSQYVNDSLVNAKFTKKSLETCLRLQVELKVIGQAFQKPPTDIMSSISVFAAWVSESDNQ